MSGETVRVRFVTQFPQYASVQGDFDISAALNRQGLSSALNQVFEPDLQVPFDFKINGNFLRQPLNSALRQYHISTESIITIEFFPAFCPPSPVDDQTTDAWISSVHFLGQSLLFSLYDGTVHIRDEAGDRCYRRAGDRVPIKCVAPIGVGRLIAGDLEGMVTLFDIGDAEAQSQFSLHSGPIHSVATFGGLEHLFVTGGADSSIQLWSTAGEANSLSGFYGHTDAVQGLEWEEEGTIVSCSLDRTIRTWDVNSQQQKEVLSASCGILSVNGRGPLIVTGHPDRSIRLWDRRAEERHAVVREFKSHKNWVSAVAWHNDEVFASASYDGSVKLWNIGTDVPLTTLFQHNEKVLALTVSAELLVAGGSDQVLRTYRFAS
jgi:ribosome biogenesis protein YTM1